MIIFKIYLMTVFVSFLLFGLFLWRFVTIWNNLKKELGIKVKEEPLSEGIRGIFAILFILFFPLANIIITFIISIHTTYDQLKNQIYIELMKRKEE